MAPAAEDTPASPTALVAGASGFLGPSIVRALRDAGWQVRGLVRSAAGAARVASAGGTPVTGDVLDPASLAAAASDCQLVVHVAAASGSGAPDRPERVRVLGARNLLAAAPQARRFVLGSGYWVYADSAGPISESSTLDPRGESRVNFETERAALAEGERRGIDVTVVRPGMVYGDGSWLEGIVAGLRDGSYRLIDGGRNPWSFVALADAGRGFAAVAAAGRPSQVYNLVDGQPIAWGEFVGDLAGRLRLPAPASVSAAEGARIYGPEVAHHLAARRACDAAKIRALGWSPQTPDARTGLARLFPSPG